MEFLLTFINEGAGSKAATLTYFASKITDMYPSLPWPLCIRAVTVAKARAVLSNEPFFEVFYAKSQLLPSGEADTRQRFGPPKTPLSGISHPTYTD
jgi:hypothetical protein